jgi:hypothetical protein
MNKEEKFLQESIIKMHNVFPYIFMTYDDRKISYILQSTGEHQAVRKINHIVFDII